VSHRGCLDSRRSERRVRSIAVAREEDGQRSHQVLRLTCRPLGQPYPRQGELETCRVVTELTAPWSPGIRGHFWQWARPHWVRAIRVVVSVGAHDRVLQTPMLLWPAKKRACLRCRSAHASCSDARPCSECVCSGVLCFEASPSPGTSSPLETVERRLPGEAREMMAAFRLARPEDRRLPTFTGAHGKRRRSRHHSHPPRRHETSEKTANLSAQTSHEEKNQRQQALPMQLTFLLNNNDEKHSRDS
jgi:hypothetical protein